MQNDREDENDDDEDDCYDDDEDDDDGYEFKTRKDVNYKIVIID